jgi:hypothetical protein
VLERGLLVLYVVRFSMAPLVGVEEVL